MALYVSTNISSINSGRQLGKASHALDTSYKRLSSGLRINSAKDDAAGLQISNRLTAQINGLNQGNRNANDGIALAQTAEGALDEVTNMLQRIRTLALQSANGTNTTTDRTSLQSEVTQLSSEIARIACKTTFAGNSILAGAGKGLLDSNGKLSLQVGANANDTVTVNLSVAFLLSKMQEVSSVSTKGLSTDKKSFDVSTVCKAQNVLEGIDSYISFVDKKRGELGAVQNRLESTIANQSNIAENESDARSRIRDTDYAEEAANLSQQTIVQQAASSMLTQANSRPQIALSLLG